MKTTRSSILVAEVPDYAELQREMHDALRAQHPEWIEADGKSPSCDYYEWRLAELLVSHRAHARAHRDHLPNKTKTERPNDHEFAKNSRSFNGFRTSANCVDLIFSLINQLPGTPLAFDVLILRQRKAIQDYETDTRNIAGGRSGVSIDALDSGLARPTVRSGGNSKRSAFRFL